MDRLVRHPASDRTAKAPENDQTAESLEVGSPLPSRTVLPKLRLLSFWKSGIREVPRNCSEIINSVPCKFIVGCCFSFIILGLRKA
ncbi:hypothetical protein ACFX13_009681 [Malus domestica]